MSSEETPRYEIAENTLKEIREVLDGREGGDRSHACTMQQVEHLVLLAEARLRMAGMRRDRRQARWFAVIPGSAFPRKSSLNKDEYDDTIRFVATITEGAKTAVGKVVEVKMPMEDAMRFAQGVLGMVETLKRIKSAKHGKGVSRD